MDKDNKLMMERFINNRKQGIDAIVESYKRGDVTKDQLIEEGLWDRVKARGAGFKSGAGQIAKNVGSVAKAGGQAVMGRGADAAQTIQNVREPSPQGMDAKSLSLVNSHIKKLQNGVAALTNDLKKLGMDPAGEMVTSNPEAATAITALQQALTKAANSFAQPKPSSRGRMNKGTKAVNALQQNVAPATTP
jgi:hypothetical protein